MIPLVSMVVARADNGVIGLSGGLPWHIPEDLKHFRRVSMGKPIIMGRTTFESIGRALPGRTNIVLTRDPHWRAEGVEVAHDWPATLSLASDVPELCVIGGAQVFAALMSYIGRAYLTEVHAEPEGDTWMPALAQADWREIERKHLPATADRPAISFVTLERMTEP